MPVRMTRPTMRAVGAVAAGAAAVTVAAVLAVPGAGAATGNAVTLPTGFTATTFAAGGTLSGPDDISRLDGDIYVAYQNGVGSMGEPSSTGKTASTLVRYAADGKELGRWDLTGKIDGMSADRQGHRIVATVNEDGNSSLYTVTPADRDTPVRHFTYAPNPLPHGGGTDAITFAHGQMFVTASAPAANADGTTYSGPALYEVRLDGTTATATPVLRDNSTATDAITGKQVTLNLSDPDSSTLLPPVTPRFGGQFLLDSQGDSQLIFLAHPGQPAQAATVLNLNTQVDDSAVAKGDGTLYVSDAGANAVLAIHGPFQPGEMLSSVPSDSTVNPATIGRDDLNTGTVTPWATGTGNPKGLLFVNADGTDSIDG